ncbi:MAG: hypothetical protein KDJ98_16970, partial [Rhodobacteraceae bacterium]|nr:hypothetical protein [Paracoccaceae bacterium]
MPEPQPVAQLFQLRPDALDSLEVVGLPRAGRVPTSSAASSVAGAASAAAAASAAPSVSPSTGTACAASAVARSSSSLAMR